MEGNFLNDSFLDKHVRSLIFCCKAFHKQVLNLHNFFCNLDHLLAFQCHICHKGMFFEAQVSYDISCIFQGGIFTHNNDIHSLISFYKSTHKSKTAVRNQWYLLICCNSKKPNVFSCKAYTSLYDNSFHICGYGNSVSSRIFCHIDTVIFIHCISLIFVICRIDRWQEIPHSHKVYIYLNDKHLGKDVGNSHLFFYCIFIHMNVALDLYHILDWGVFHNSNSI